MKSWPLPQILLLAFFYELETFKCTLHILFMYYTLAPNNGTCARVLSLSLHLLHHLPLGSPSAWLNPLSWWSPLCGTFMSCSDSVLEPLNIINFVFLHFSCDLSCFCTWIIISWKDKKHYGRQNLYVSLISTLWCYSHDYVILHGNNDFSK